MPIVEFSSIPAQEKMVNVHTHYMLNCKIVHVYADLGIVVGGGGGGGAAWKSRHTTAAWKKSCVDPEGGGGQGGPPPWKITRYMRGSRGGRTGGSAPPGKSQVIWGSIGNKQVDPSLKKLDPPPLTWKKLNPLRNREN